MSSSLGRLEGKVAVVTGGAGEIGRAITNAFLNEGATVVITGRNVQKLQRTVDSYISERPGSEDRIQFLVMDNSDEESIEAGVRILKEKFKKIHILVNNAGTAGPQQELSNIPLETTENVESLKDSIGSLLLGPWLTTKLFLPILSNHASVINVSTIFSLSNYYGRAAYSVPKAALNTLSRLMAIELGRDPRRIRVNTVLPGPVETDRIRRVFSAMDNLRGALSGTTKAEVLDRMILQQTEKEGEFIPREDVAQSVLFLASDASKSFTAHQFEVARGFGPNDQSVCQLNFRPKTSSVAGFGKLIWIIAGRHQDEVCELIESYRDLGYTILATFQNTEVLATVQSKYKDQVAITLMKFDIHSEQNWKEIEAYLKNQNPYTWDVVVVPRGECWKEGSVLQADTEFIRNFVHDEIEGSIVIAKRLEQLFKYFDQKLQAAPSVTFLSNRSNGEENVFPRLKRGALQQLIRTWRDENKIGLARGVRTRGVHSYQLIRYENESAINLELCFDWLVSLASGNENIGAIDLVLDSALEAHQPGSRNNQIENAALQSLHRDRVALITGGSEGIGGAISMRLVTAGARVVIAERSAEKLKKIQQQLTSIAKECNFPNPAGRVMTLSETDVARLDSLSDLVQKVVSKFGRIDFIINNAGLSGAETLVADIALEDWINTIYGNLVSNYLLTYEAVPFMVRQKCGHIVNMSSYFGNSRFGFVPYTNRSDYAVSKAGQIALVEALAGFLGPHIQINALAPGPVDGARLNGTGGRPGLYLRRAQLIREGRRLNRIYNCIISLVVSEAMDLGEIMTWVCKNDLSELMKPTVPKELRDLASEFFSDTKLKNSGAGRYLLPRRQYDKLCRRLSVRLGSSGTIDPQLTFQEATEPFFPREIIEADAALIRQKMLNTIALQKMPTDKDLANEVSNLLAHGVLTGEVLFPSCGFRMDGFRLGDTFGGPDLENFPSRGLPKDDVKLETLGKTVFIVGNSMIEEMANCADFYSRNCKVVVLGPDKFDVKMVRAGRNQGNLHFISGLGLTFTEILKRAIDTFGNPEVVVSFPMGPVLKAATGFQHGINLPSIREFKEFIDSNLTNHFQVCKKTVLFDPCRTIIVTPSMSGKTSEEKIWIRFLRETLKPFTAAVAREATFFPHSSTFYQVGCDSGVEDLVQIIVAMSGAQVISTHRIAAAS